MHNLHQTEVYTENQRPRCPGAEMIWNGRVDGQADTGRYREAPPLKISKKEPNTSTLFFVTKYCVQDLHILPSKHQYD